MTNPPSAAADAAAGSLTGERVASVEAPLRSGPLASSALLRTGGRARSVNGREGHGRGGIAFLAYHPENRLLK